MFFLNVLPSYIFVLYHIRKQANKQTASTIIEYLDKETNQPVALLFPHGLHIKDGFEEKYMDCLNHATRRDLAKQINIRKNLIERLNQNVK